MLHDSSWPMATARVVPGVTVLRAPFNPKFDVRGIPDDPEPAAAALRAIAAIRADRMQPQVVVAYSLQTEGAVWEALKSLEAEGAITLAPVVTWERGILERAAAPDAASYFNTLLSSAQRKRMRQKRKALEELGVLRFHVSHDVEGIQRDFDAYVALEAAGWKGLNGTALQQDSKGLAYISGRLLARAGTGLAFTAALTVDGRAIAVGLFFRSGGEVDFCKTTYDETLAKHSPGVIFDTMLTEWLFDQSWFQLLDSGHDDSVDPSRLMWKQRRSMAHVVIDLRPGSWRGRAVVAGLRLRQRLRLWKMQRQAEAK